MDVVAPQTKSGSDFLPFEKMPPRLAKIFQANKILTYSELTEISEGELMKFRGISKGYLEDARRLLAMNGMTFRCDPVPVKVYPNKEKFPPLPAQREKKVSQKPKRNSASSHPAPGTDEHQPTHQSGDGLPFEKIPSRLARVLKTNKILTITDLENAMESDLKKVRGISRGYYEKMSQFVSNKETKRGEREKTANKGSMQNKVMTAMFLCDVELPVIATMHDMSQQQALRIVCKTILRYSIHSMYKWKREPTKILQLLFDFPAE